MAIGESSDTQIVSQRSTKPTSRKISVGYYFIAPALIILLITSVYPVIYSLILSTL